MSNVSHIISSLVKDAERESQLPKEPINFKQLEEIICKWLLIEDKGLIKIVAGTVVANMLVGDPVWLFIVAAPGGTKTELIRGLSKVPKVYPISDLTPQTLLSGEKGKNASLLLRVEYGTIFTYKDFTTVLSMHRDKQQAIISQLREIFDGSYRKEFGTGETKNWEGKIGFIAGVTPVIDRHYEIYSVLGERFIQYRPSQPDSVKLAKKAIANRGGENAMRSEIQNAFANFIASIEIPDTPPQLSEDTVDRVANLAAFCVKARSGVMREGYSTREIELIPDSELPTRLAKQLMMLATAFFLIDSTNPEADYELIFKIAMDSIPKKRRSVLEMLAKREELVETAEVAMEIGYPTNTTRRILEDLHGLGLLHREHEGRGYADKWKLNDYARGLLDKALPESLKVKEATPDNSDIAQEVTLPDTSDDIEVSGLFDEPKETTAPEMSEEKNYGN